MQLHGNDSVLAKQEATKDAVRCILRGSPASRPVTKLQVRYQAGFSVPFSKLSE